MSYILDALKRADAERGRGQLPGLQSQPLAPGPSLRTGSSGTRIRMLTGIVLLAGLVGAGAWWMGRSSAPAQAPSPPPTSSLPPAPVAVPVPVAETAPSPRPAAPDAVASPSPAVPSPPPNAMPVEPARRPATAGAAAPAPPPKASAPTTAERMPALAELPEDLRRQMPTLTVSGLVHSANPAHRLLVLNGQVYAEGSRPTPELLIEQIRPTSAVLSFRGQRFSVSQ